MRMTMMACLLYRMLPLMALGGLSSGAMRGGMVAWSATVAASRVAYGRHHLLDVVAGVAVGVFEYNFHIGSLWVPIDQAVTWQAMLAVPLFQS
jgi:hypothetical protein